MKQSTPTSPKPKEPRAILLIGPPGGGKTTLAMQFPNVCFLDCDRNLDGPDRFIRQKNKELAYCYEPIVLDDDGNPVPVEKCFDRLVDKLTQLKTNKDVKTVVIDSLTMVNEFIIRKVLFEQGKKTFMEPHFWAPFKSHFWDLLVGKIRGTGKTSICTVHEEMVMENDATKVMVTRIIGFVPTVQGKIGDYFGAFFTDIWRCTSAPAPGGATEFNIWGTRTSQSDLKSSIGLPAKLTVKSGELAFDAVKSYLKDIL